MEKILRANQNECYSGAQGPEESEKYFYSLENMKVRFLYLSPIITVAAHVLSLNTETHK